MADGLLIENKTNHLIKKDKKGKYNDNLISEYLKRIKVVNLNFYKTYGNDDNAMNTALFCSFENIVFDSISKYLKTKNEVLNAYNNVDAKFCNNENTTSLYGVIKISLLDVIISLISSKLKSKKIT